MAAAGSVDSKAHLAGHAPKHTGAALILGSAVVACFGVGTGFRNGDAVVYLDQALRGDLSQRVVHVGYLAAAALAALPSGDHLPLVLDLLSVAAFVGASWCMSRRGDAIGGVFALALLPTASWSEVDLWWIALWAAALIARRTSTAGLLLALATTFSPTLLLALPAWWVLRPEKGRALLGPLATVLVLTVATAGDWWLGERGVLSPGSHHLGRVLQQWGLMLLPCVWLVPALQRRERLGLLACLPLLLVPADVPAWGPAAAILSLAVVRVRGLSLSLGLAAQCVYSLALWWTVRTHVVTENEFARAVAAELSNADALVAPWSMGIRISWYATASPYGLRWRTPRGFVHDQRARWCASVPTRVAVVNGSTMGWASADGSECF